MLEDALNREPWTMLPLNRKSGICASVPSPADGGAATEAGPAPKRASSRGARRGLEGRGGCAKD